MGAGGCGPNTYVFTSGNLGLGGHSMNDAGMTPEDEHEFYSRPENQVPRGHARRRSLLRRSGCRVAAAVRSRKRPRDENPG